MVQQFAARGGSAHVQSISPLHVQHVHTWSSAHTCGMLQCSAA
eukprot:CAMPEP_0115683136 /NCGR_PEP_ID=MMETSP0272-20121206/58227_1 /TAXON_ID=71861 /ORGANISM="Scrippsiella trochoidea, Strain CCMP3099" /LENGTH=42 /DNA_ID= /DNA_START= /DNA_END= /DNA_ORIENTATION=